MLDMRSASAWSWLVLDAGAVSCQPPSQPNKIFPITSRRAAAQQQPLGTGRSEWDCQIVSGEARRHSQSGDLMTGNLIEFKVYFYFY